jgi:hypothetical protein
VDPRFAYLPRCRRRQDQRALRSARPDLSATLQVKEEKLVKKLLWILDLFTCHATGEMTGGDSFARPDLSATLQEEEEKLVKKLLWILD